MDQMEFPNLRAMRRAQDGAPYPGLTLERAEEFFEEVGGSGGAVFGCAADVVYWFGFVDESGAGVGDCFWGEGFVDEGLFGGVEAGGDFAQAGCGDSYGFYDVVVCTGDSGQGNFRDCLCVACAYLADIGFVTFKVT